MKANKKRWDETTDSCDLILSWMEIYMAILNAENEKIDRLVKSHAELCGFVESSTERVEIRVTVVMSMPLPELKELIQF